MAISVINKHVSCNVVLSTTAVTGSWRQQKFYAIELSWWARR